MPVASYEGFIELLVKNQELDPIHFLVDSDYSPELIAFLFASVASSSYGVDSDQEEEEYEVLITILLLMSLHEVIRVAKVICVYWVNVFSFMEILASHIVDIILMEDLSESLDSVIDLEVVLFHNFEKIMHHKNMILLIREELL